MKVGDLVRHRNDGDIGIVLAIRDRVAFRYWVEVRWISSPYNAGQGWHNPFVLEILSGSR